MSDLQARAAPRSQRVPWIASAVNDVLYSVLHTVAMYLDVDARLTGTPTEVQRLLKTRVFAGAGIARAQPPCTKSIGINGLSALRSVRHSVGCRANLICSNSAASASPAHSRPMAGQRFCFPRRLGKACLTTQIGQGVGRIALLLPL